VQVIDAMSQSHRGARLQRQADVAVIVLNWNRRDDTLRCLESLVAVADPVLDIIVVDNASTDDSRDAIRARFPNVQQLQNERNLGFAEGNNTGLRAVLAAGYPYVILLNNDTVVAVDAIRELVQPLVDDPSIGITGAAICYLDAPDTIWSAGGRVDWDRGTVTSDFYNRPLGGLPAEPFEVDHVTGCAIALRAPALAAGGLLDSRFFMYFEETEWCVRIARQGYRIVVCPRSRVWHAIDPRAQEGSPAIAYYMTRNHLLFLRATRAPLRAWLYTVGWQLRTLASLFVRPGSVARARGRVPMLRAMRDFVVGRFGSMASAR
jgi:GT2 family glycosyltransferase